MAFKFVIFALTLAYANAGNLIAQPAAVHYSSAPAVSSSYFQQASAPVAYAKTLAAPAVAAVAPAPAVAYQAAPAFAYQSAPVAVHAPSVGLSQQTVARSLGGAQSVSTYSKAVDSAFSSVRKYDTRITNDGLSFAPAQVAYSAPLVTKAYAAPAPVAYAAPAPVAYAAPAQVVTKTYAAPAPVAYAAPAHVVTKTYAAPAPVAYAAPAPVAYGAPAHVAYAAPAQVVTKSYAAPAPVAYAAPAQVVTKTYAAPAPVLSYSAPAPLAVAKTIAPVATYAAAPQLVAKAAVAYSPAATVAHTTFQGYGVEYQY